MIANEAPEATVDREGHAFDVDVGRERGIGARHEFEDDAVTQRPFPQGDATHDRAREFARESRGARER